MVTSRSRFWSFFEWVLAVAGLAAVLSAGSIAMSEFRSVSAVIPVSAREALAPAPPAGIPPRSVSVPVLLLGGGTEIRVGDNATDVEARLGAESHTGVMSIERGPYGDRLIRGYVYAETRFVLVFDVPQRNAAQAVSAIYLQ